MSASQGSTAETDETVVSFTSSERSSPAAGDRTTGPTAGNVREELNLSSVL